MKKQSNFAERLTLLMELRNITKSDIAKICGIDRSNITRYCNGEYQAKQDVIYKMAAKLNVNPAWLMGYDVPINWTPAFNLSPNIIPMPSTYNVPRLGRIACGEPILAEQNIEDYDAIPDYVKCDFTLVCKGDSMINARIFDGDIVCISTKYEVKSGDIAAVMVGDDEATLKRVRLYDDHIVLEPENPQYKPFVFWEDDMNEVHIIGKATHFISSIR